MPLTDIIIANDPPRDSAYKLASEKGLYLLVNPNGSRYWRFDYRFEGKRKTLSMGVYPEISLDIARTRRDEARELLAQHINPAEVRKQARSTAVAKISQPSLQFSMTDSGGLLIENKSGKMVLNAEQVIALRAFIDATREEQPCL
jgi:hypothetical protein